MNEAEPFARPLIGLTLRSPHPYRGYLDDLFTAAIFLAKKARDAKSPEARARCELAILIEEARYDGDLADENLRRIVRELRIENVPPAFVRSFQQRFGAPSVPGEVRPLIAQRHVSALDIGGGIYGDGFLHLFTRELEAIDSCVASLAQGGVAVMGRNAYGMLWVSGIDPASVAARIVCGADSLARIRSRCRSPK